VSGHLDILRQELDRRRRRAQERDGAGKLDPESLKDPLGKINARIGAFGAPESLTVGAVSDLRGARDYLKAVLVVHPRVVGEHAPAAWPTTFY